jgi:hypothetical protein
LAEHIVHTREMTTAYKILVENIEEKRAEIAQSLQQVATGWMTKGSEFESR